MTHTETEIPETKCPACGIELSMVSGVEGTVPQPGATIICVGCRRLLVLTEALDMRLMDPQEEWEVRRRNPQIAKMERTIGRLKGEWLACGDKPPGPGPALGGTS